MAHFSYDIITEILCRLAVEDLLRYRCVSKPLCSLIDSPDFIKHHLSHSHSLKTNTHLSLILRSSESSDFFSVNLDSLETAHELNHPPDLNLTPGEKGEETEILGSCNGLLALLNVQNEIILWNPSTRKSQMLPDTEKELPQWKYTLGFFFYGLGYDPISDDYKFVRMVQFYDKDDSFKSEVKVYSLKTNSWRRIKDFPYYPLYRVMYGILVNNALHLMVTKKPQEDLTESLIAAFDLGTEEYRLVSLPNCLGDVYEMQLEALGDCLCMIATYWEDANYCNHPVVNIWMMKEYGVKESWTKLLSVKLEDNSLFFGFVCPLAYSKNGDKVLLNEGCEKFVWYDLRRKRVKNVGIRGAPSSFEVKMLVGSLVPLNGNINGNGD